MLDLYCISHGISSICSWFVEVSLIIIWNLVQLLDCSIYMKCRCHGDIVSSVLLCRGRGNRGFYCLMMLSTGVCLISLQCSNDLWFLSCSTHLTKFCSFIIVLSWFPCFLYDIYLHWHLFWILITWLVVLFIDYLTTAKTNKLFCFDVRVIWSFISNLPSSLYLCHF